MASALSTYDSALSELDSTSSAGETDLDKAQKSVVESIIIYNLASQNSTDVRCEWNASGNYYTVYYKDAKGRELSQVYQYSVDESGKVTVK